MKESFDIFLIVMAVAALGVFVALHFFEAGYGFINTLSVSETCIV